MPGRTRALCACVLLFGFMYGIAMGSYGGVGGDRVWQLLYSGLKVPLLLLATFFIGLPSFFVLNTLFGLRRDFREALCALVAAQAGVAIVLASCAPLTLFWYASFADYSAALLFNGLIFAVASFAGQFLLRGYYRPLTAQRASRTFALDVAGALRIHCHSNGLDHAALRRRPSAPVEFFRTGDWENAYVVVARLVFDALWR